MRVSWHGLEGMNNSTDVGDGSADALGFERTGSERALELQQTQDADAA